MIKIINFYLVKLYSIFHHYLLWFCAVLWPLYHYQQKHPQNFIFLGLFTVCLSLTIGVACANTEGMCVTFISFCFMWLSVLTDAYGTHAGRIVIQALVLTAAVVCSLTGYTFWAAKRGKDFSFLGPVLFASLVGIVFAGLLQVLLVVYYRGQI